MGTLSIWQGAPRISRVGPTPRRLRRHTMTKFRIHDGTATAYPLHVLRGYAVLAGNPSADHFVWGGYYEEGSLIWRSRWVTETGVIECRDASAFPGDPDRVVLLRRIIAAEGDAHACSAILVGPTISRRPRSVGSAPAARRASPEIERPNTASSVRSPAVSLSSQSEFGESDARVIALPRSIPIHRSGVPWRKRCSTTLR